MHIGTGIHEGKQIKDAKGSSLSCRLLTVKEEIFTIISTRVNEAHILDINDSNGMYGIEALSRGAKYARFVNSDLTESHLTAENLDSLGLDSKDMVICDGAEEYLENPKDGSWSSEKYDVAFFNIKKPEEFELLPNVLARQNENGVTIVLYPDLPKFVFPENLPAFKVVETRDCEDKKIAIILKNQD